MITKKWSSLLNTLSIYLKNKENILSKLITLSKNGRKGTRELENAGVDEFIYEWFKQIHDKKFYWVDFSSSFHFIQLKNSHYNYKNTILRQTVDSSMI